MLQYHTVYAKNNQRQYYDSHNRVDLPCSGYNCTAIVNESLGIWELSTEVALQYCKNIPLFPYLKDINLSILIQLSNFITFK